MTHRVRFIHWKPEEAKNYIQLLVGAAYTVDYGKMSNNLLKEIRENPPDAILIDLSRAPSQGRDMGISFRKYNTTRIVPILFIGGEPDKVDRVKETLPDAIYTSCDTFEDDLKDAIDNPLDDPIVHDSLFAGYSGTPLAKKLGIMPNSVVRLINPPKGFEKSIGKIPDGVSFFHGEVSSPDITVWFCSSLSELLSGLDRYSSFYGDCRLWISWPKKSSGVDSDLNQKVVRKEGLAIGLVDFKIVAIDKTWSALCFTRRKEN